MRDCIIDTLATVYASSSSLAPKAARIGACIETWLFAQIDAILLRHMHDYKISSLNITQNRLLSHCI